MDLDTDPDVLRRAAERLTALSGELLAEACRLGGHGPGPSCPGDGPPWSRHGARRPDPATWSAVRSVTERIDRHRAHLADGLRVDAAELLGSARRLHEDRAALLAGDTAATDALTALHRAW